MEIPLELLNTAVVRGLKLALDGLGVELLQEGEVALASQRIVGLEDVPGLVGEEDLQPLQRLLRSLEFGEDALKHCEVLTNS